MKSSFAAVLAVAATASAWANDTIVYTTKVVDVYTTVCPASATITFNGVTYTNTETESSTITITNCPCTVSAPVYTTSAVYCNTCVVPTTSAAPVAPVYTNGTTAAPVAPTTSKGSVGTTVVPSSKPSATTVPASGANQVIAMSGASLAGLLGLAAYLL